MARLLLLLLLLPTLAFGADARRAGEIQLQAKDAYSKGNIDEAYRLAQRAISLEAGPSTWLAQQIRIEVLEERGQLEEAMTHLRAYLQIDGLFPEHQAWGAEAKGRIGSALKQVRAGRQARQGIGAGLAIGGVAPLGIGIGLLANYGVKTGAGGDADWYAGFLDAGIALTLVGGVMEGAGIGLIASGAAPPNVALRRAPRPSLALGPDGSFVLGLHGRF